MRPITSDNRAALKARRLVPQDFIWITARSYSTGAPVEWGFWSGRGNVSAQVLQPDFGLPVTRNFEGAGSLIDISDIPLVSKIAAQPVTITLSQLNEATNAVVRGYDLKQAGIEIYRGLFSPDTRLPVDAATCRFIGFVDVIDITTPKEGEAGAITLTCMSHALELTRSNPDTRSHESQLRRDASDNFYVDTSTVGDWEHFWGGKTQKIETAGPQRIGINVPPMV